MAKKIMVMLALVASIILISACASTSTNKSPAPEADKVALKALEAIVDYDVATLQEIMTDNALDNAKKTMTGIPAFRDYSEEKIKNIEPYDKGDFERYTSDGDYFFGAYYGFLEGEERVLYIAEMYNITANTLHTEKKGDRKQYRFELVKENGEWKLDTVRGWKKSTVKDKSDKYINCIFSGSEDTKIFHRGGDY